MRYYYPMLYRDTKKALTTLRHKRLSGVMSTYDLINTTLDNGGKALKILCKADDLLAELIGDGAEGENESGDDD